MRSGLHLKLGIALMNYRQHGVKNQKNQTRSDAGCEFGRSWLSATVSTPHNWWLTKLTPSNKSTNAWNMIRPANPMRHANLSLAVMLLVMLEPVLAFWMHKRKEKCWFCFAFFLSSFDPLSEFVWRLQVVSTVVSSVASSNIIVSAWNSEGAFGLVGLVFCHLSLVILHHSSFRLIVWLDRTCIRL